MITQSQHLGGLELVLDGGGLKGGHMEQNRTKAIGFLGKTGLWALFLAGLGLSMAFPFGIGFVVFLSLVILFGALFVVGILSFGLLKDMLGKSATFGYTPTTAYMAGKKMKRKKKADAADQGKP